MFTGIVEEVGTVVQVTRLAGESARLTIRGPLVVTDAGPGDSIAVDGVCLTVVETGPEHFSADAMAETMQRSALGRYRPGAACNLERAATMSTRLGGHLVQGHVDGVGRLLARSPAEHWDLVEIDIPSQLSRYLVEKGSVAVDGASLTVVTAGPESFTVGLIPTTLERTTLGGKAVGDPVNLEVDLIAKYVERMLTGAPGPAGERP